MHHNKDKEKQKKKQNNTIKKCIYFTRYSVNVPYISNTIELTRLIDGVGCFVDKVLAGQYSNSVDWFQFMAGTDV